MIGSGSPKFSVALNGKDKKKNNSLPALPSAASYKPVPSLFTTFDKVALQSTELA